MTVSSEAASSSRRWWALIAIAASVVVVGLDLTVLSLALPTIAGDLHASTADLQWISDSYSLVLAAIAISAHQRRDGTALTRVTIFRQSIETGSDSQNVGTPVRRSQEGGEGGSQDLVSFSASTGQALTAARASLDSGGGTGRRSRMG